MRVRRTLSKKLILAFLSGSVVIVALFSLVIRGIISDYFERQAEVRNEFVRDQGQKEVRANLAILKEDFSEALSSYAAALVPLGDSGAIGDRVTRLSTIRKDLAGLLDRLQQKTGLSMITLVDTDGRVLVRATSPSDFGDLTLMRDYESARGQPSSTKRLIAAALAGRTIQSFESFAAEVLEREVYVAPNGRRTTLAAQARIPLKTTATTQDVIVEGQFEDRGMVLTVVTPIRRSDGGVVGAIVAAKLLNWDPAFVQKIQGLLNDHITIFLGRVRVATSLSITTGPSAGQNGTGTLLPQDRSGVLDRGEYVERESNIGGEKLLGLYEPIRNSEGQIIGALWLGRPLSFINSITERQEQMERAVSRRTNLYIAGLAAVSLLTSIVIAMVFARRITRQLDQLRRGAEVIAQGNLDYRLDLRSGDEIETLSKQFNVMASKLHESYQTLENKVEERTRELRESQQTVIQQEKMVGIGQLAAGVAHELNTPLGTIIGYAQMLKEDLAHPGTVPSASDADEIIDQAGRCRDLVKNLLNFSRRSGTERTATDINAVARKILSLIEHDFQLKGVRVSLQLDSSVPPIRANENEIGQVIMNLANNAVDSMPRGGDLHISTSHDKATGRVCIAVRDNGCGIPESDRNRVFEPFFTTKEVGKGTGLGLSICYKIVENHFGTIDFESTAGNGTIFRVYLPAQPVVTEVQVG